MLLWHTLFCFFLFLVVVVFFSKICETQKQRDKVSFISCELQSCLTGELVIFISESKLFYSMRFAKREFADRMIRKKDICKHISREILN